MDTTRYLGGLPLQPEIGQSGAMTAGTTPAVRKNERHFLAADILRGVAILMVLAYHALLRSWPWDGWWVDFRHLPGKSTLALYPASMGWAGVSLFFVLSGFCIHVSFLRTRNFTFAHFFWQRFWRIYPAYLAALVAFSIFRQIDFSSNDGIKMFLSHALLIHNLFPAWFFGINSSFWSLGTEMQLYFLYPLLLFLRRRFGIERCLAIIFAVSLAWRILAIACWGLPEHLIDPAFCSPLVTWFDWALGAYVAEQIISQKTAFTHHAVWLLVMVPLFVFSTAFKPLATCSFSLAAVISAVVLDRIARVTLPSNIFLKALAGIGLVSYSIYLWHQPMLDLLPRALDPHSYLLPRLATLVLIGVVAVASYLCFEKPGVKAGKSIWKWKH